MRISNVLLSDSAGHRELAASIDGQPLWFRFPPDHRVHVRAEPFVAAVLPVAMRAGAPLHVEGPLSRVFLDAVGELQAIFHCWNHELRPVEIRCDSILPAPAAGAGTAAFFSGGIDSMFTLLRHREKIADLLFFTSGFDLDSTGIIAERSRRYRELADTLGKRLVPIEMNFRAFSDAARLRWGFAHGFALAAVSLAVGAETVLVASGQTYRHLEPWGSHPLTDTLWATEAVRVVHDGAGATRFDKTAYIATDPVLLKHLHVCWAEPLKNCGRCSKCIRTSAALRLLGVTSPALAPLEDVRLLRRLRPHNARQAEFLLELLEAGLERGDHALVRMLRSQLWRFELKELGIAADRVLLGSTLKRLYLRALEPEWSRMTAPGARRA